MLRRQQRLRWQVDNTGGGMVELKATRNLTKQRQIYPGEHPWLNADPVWSMLKLKSRKVVCLSSLMFVEHQHTSRPKRTECTGWPRKLSESEQLALSLSSLAE